MILTDRLKSIAQRMTSQRLRRSRTTLIKPTDGGNNTITAEQEIVSASKDVIMRIGLDMRANYVSASALEVLGYRPDEIVGHGPGEFVHPDDLVLVVADSRSHLSNTSECDAITHRMIRKNGGVIWVECRNRALTDSANGSTSGFVLSMRDITTQKHRQDQLEALALSDGLTGLANRRAFDQALSREWLRTQRESTAMSLLLIDVDHFKVFNDQYGHQVGDDCLRAIAAAIAGVLSRPADLAARYGGEEFAVILGSTDAAGAVLTANKIRENIEVLQLPHAGNAEGFGYVSASIGAATALCRVGGTIEMPQSLLGAADSALYKAKQCGRNQVATALLLTTSETS